ncbi:MAG TPA: YlxR family protein [Aeromicrobium sp.]|nr:YlxR family protein [Aeromicrobium sp.]HKY59269.1 YlxR family protein [Aeromicrobium sp.]
MAHRHPVRHCARADTRNRAGRSGLTTEGRLGGPVRTCIGCRERADRTALVRFVATAGESGSQTWIVTPDLNESLPGRGAHLHPEARCYDQARRRRAFGRALRVEGTLDLGPVEELAKTWPS